MKTKVCRYYLRQNDSAYVWTKIFLKTKNSVSELENVFTKLNVRELKDREMKIEENRHRRVIL